MNGNERTVPSVVNPLVTRRSVLASAAALFRAGTTAVGGQTQAKPIVPFDLGHGLEIRDYRIFPTEDVRRFIVELHNSSDEIIDTPSVGVVLPHLNPEGNFAWSNPISTVLYPGMSDLLIGVAPAHLTSDTDWGEPEWVLCGEISTTQVERVEGWDYSLSWTIEVLAPDAAWVKLLIANYSANMSHDLIVRGIVRDSQNRICGTCLPVTLSGAEPKIPLVREWGLYEPTMQHISSPFRLLDTVEDVTVDFTVQPYFYRAFSSCLADLQGIQN